jgi:hydroxymethylbilane synthase
MLTRVGTRGSALALRQSGWVAAELEARGVQAELVQITTTGDRGQGVGDKARWTSELESALLDGRIDVAVHSAKDVPGEIADGTQIAAIPMREEPYDVICGAASLDLLRAGARIGTSSLRRAAQIRAFRDDVEIVELRGNVDTRLRKLAEGQADAIVIAAAGLNRLGRADAAGGVLESLVPAPGQGALIVQARSDDAAVLTAVRGLSDDLAEVCVLAERAFASALNATCNTPLGASAMPAGEHTRLRGWLGLPDGSHWISDELIGEPKEVGAALARRMISVGARELLEAAEVMATS